MKQAIEANIDLIERGDWYSLREQCNTPTLFGRVLIVLLEANIDVQPITKMHIDKERATTIIQQLRNVRNSTYGVFASEVLAPHTLKSIALIASFLGYGVYKVKDTSKYALNYAIIKPYASLESFLDYRDMLDGESGAMPYGVYDYEELDIEDM